MIRPLRWLPVLVLAPFLLHAALREEPVPPTVIPAAFHWRNNNWFTSDEHYAVEQRGIQRLYFKFLDIDHSPAHSAHPVSFNHIPYEWKGYENAGMWTGKVEFVPSIYITNNTFLQLDKPGVRELASNLLRKLRQDCPIVYDGLLLDCDWTAKTKASFFELTRIINDSLAVPVGATIRLHQYADPKGTGIPPADRGMLMVYNVGRVKDHGTKNSIFDLEMAKPYFTSSKPYPLPLDMALPAFSWGAQFRQGRFLGVINEDVMDEAITREVLLQKDKYVYQVTREDNNRFPQLHIGDEVRVEGSTQEVVSQAAQLAQTAVNTDTFAVAFFETGSNTFQGLPKEFTDSTVRSFGTVKPNVHFPEPGEGGLIEVTPAIDTVWMAVDSTATPAKP